MKLKHISAACLALCAGGAFAQACTITYANAGTTNQAQLVNACAPEVTFYVGGASAQRAALKTVLTTDGVVFDLSKPLVKVRSTANSISGNGLATVALNADGNTIAYVGYGASGLGANGAQKRVMVIYNIANGSIAGVNQLLTGKGGNLEEVVLQTVTAKEQAAGTVKTCSPALRNGVALTGQTPDTASTTASDNFPTFACSTEAAFSTAWGADKQKNMHLALSDVRPNEAVPATVNAAALKWKDAKAPSTSTAVQGFGVVVSPALYGALITKNIAQGKMASTCTSEIPASATTAVGTVTLACQPTITSAEMAAVMSGKYQTVNDLTGNGDITSDLVLARRTDTSGTQAAATIFFAGRGAYNSKTPLVDGYLDVKPAGTYGKLVVEEKTATGDVRTAVGAALGKFSLGVVSLENAQSSLSGGAYVKIDGVSPIYTTAGLDSTRRAAILAGYPFAFDMQAVKSAKYTVGVYATIADAIISNLKSPKSNLSGLAYLPGSAAATVPALTGQDLIDATARETTFTRGTSNLFPLTKY